MSFWQYNYFLSVCAWGLRKDECFEGLDRVGGGPVKRKQTTRF